MNTYNYQQFVKETRDKIAPWIDDPKKATLFADDLTSTETLWQKHRKHLQKINEQWQEFHHNPQRQNRRQNKQEPKQNNGDVFDYPEMEKGPNGMKHKPPENPLEKFRLPIKPTALSVNDYRILLGVLHDGFTSHERDKSRYFCPELRKKGTIVDVLFWDYMWYEPRYKPLIDEALRIVESDINETQHKKPQGKDGHDNGGKARDRKQGAPETKPDSTSAQSIHIQNFQGILGDVQAENVQTGDKTLIHKHSETEKKKKGILRNLWWIITAIVGFLGSLLGIFNHLGWLESLKLFFYKLFIHK